MSQSVCVGISKTLGIRGVLATNDITNGSLIESCPIIKITKNEVRHMEQTILDNYLYEWNESYDCLVLGYCGLANHADKPNAKYVHNHENDTMDYIAVTDIKKGEEVTVHYNGDPYDTTPLDPGHINADKRHKAK